MNLNETELETVQELASLFYSPSEVAVVLEVDQDDFVSVIRSGGGDVYRAYMKGYFEGDIDLRRSIKDSALHGSSPAQAIMREIQKLSKVSG